MYRNFPEAFADRRDFLLWRRRGTSFELGHYDGSDWAWSRSYLDRPRHTLEELESTLAITDDSGAFKYHAALCPEGSGLAVIDFDFKKFAELAAKHPERQQQIDANREMMNLWLEQLREYTYVEESKTAGCYHAVIEYKHARRSIGADAEGNEIKLPLDLIGAGFIVMTGNGAGEVNAPAPDDLAMIENLWDKHSSEPAPVGQMWFGRGERRRLLEVNAAPLRQQENLSLDEVYERMQNFDAKYEWHIHGRSDYQPKGRAEERLNFLQAAAFVTYGAPNAMELIWDAIANSWFALVYTPETSNSNKKRFETRSQIRWIREKEIPLAIALAHEKAVEGVKDREFMAPKIALLLEGEKKKEEEIEAKVEEQEQKRAKALPPKREKKHVDVVNLPDSLLFNELQALYNRSVNHRLPQLQWDRISTLFAAATFTGACYRTASATTPAIMVPGVTGAGKENPKKFMAGIIRAMAGGLDVPYFDLVESISHGTAIRDNVADDRMLILVATEAAALLTQIGEGDEHLQAYLPAAIDGAPIARSIRANVTKDKESKSCHNPRFAVLLSAQPHWFEGMFSHKAIAGGIVSRFTYFPEQSRQRWEVPEYVTQVTDPSVVVALARYCMRRSKRHESTQWLMCQDEAGLMARLHKEFPPMGALEPVHSRLSQFVQRWAAVSYASREIGELAAQWMADHKTLQGFDQSGATCNSWEFFSQEDIEFGIAVAHMSVDVLQNMVGWSSVNSVNVQYHVVLTGILKAAQEALKRGYDACSPSRAHQLIPKRAKDANDRNEFKDQLQLVKQRMDELASEGVFRTERRSNRGMSYLITDVTVARLETRMAELGL